MDPTRTYLTRTTGILHDELGDRLYAVFVGGSMALDDYHPPASDVDLLVVTGGPAPATVLSRLATRLDHRRHPCPAAGLDLVAYERGEVEQPSPDVTALFGFVTGPRWRTELSPSERSAAFLLDLAIVRQAGRPLHGPSPDVVIGRIPRAWIEPPLRAIIPWHRRHVHDPFHDPKGTSAVLNACRAWRCLVDGRFTSKSGAARWAMRRLPGASIIREALDCRHGSRPAPLPRQAVLDLLDRIEERMSAGASGRSSLIPAKPEPTPDTDPP